MNVNQVCMLIAIIIVLSVTIFFIFREGFSNLTGLIDTIYSTQLEVMLASFLGGIVGLGVLIIAFILKLIVGIFSKNIAIIIESVFAYAYITLWCCFLVGIIFTIITFVVLSCITIPISNYARALGEVYKEYYIGKIYYWIWHIISFVIPIVLIVYVIICFFPVAKGFVSIRGELEQNCFEELMLNGSIQAGGEAFIPYEGFYSNHVWYKYSDSEYRIPYYAKNIIGNVGVERKTVLNHSKGELPNFVYIDNMLIGVEDDEVTYSSVQGYAYRKKKLDWREAISTDGCFEYDKIASIVKKQMKGSISMEEAASIIGVMQEGTLVGINPIDGAIVVKEEQQDGYHFLRIGEDIKDSKALHVDDSKPIVYVYTSNSVFYIDEEGYISGYNYNDEKSVEITYNSKKIRADNFNYSVFSDDAMLFIIRGRVLIHYPLSQNEQIQTSSKEILGIDGSDTVLGLYCSPNTICIKIRKEREIRFVCEYLSEDKSPLGEHIRVISDKINPKIKNCRRTLEKFMRKKLNLF